METQRYLYETHMHTSEASACAGSTGAQMARAYKEAGYTGIIVTDHFFYGNTSVDRSLPWEEWVRRFCLGYEHAKAEGERIGLSVFFGWEACYEGTEFLVYGLDQAWLLAHPQIKDASIEEQYALVHEGGGIISHAHPFREEDYIPEIRLFPEYVDAVEGVNAMHSVEKVRPKPIRYTPPTPQQAEKKPENGAVIPAAARLSFDAHDLPFEPGSMVTLYGNPPKGRPIEMAQVNIESGNVTVWGDVFKIDRRTSRDEKTLILSIYFTDYTGSYCVSSRSAL